MTSTQVESATFTRTVTQTSTYTRTGTFTNTPTSTLTRTSTSTPTFSQTATSSQQPTMTATPTATKTQISNQQPAINNVIISPNPYNPTKGDLKINILITGQLRIIKIKIYTVSYRLIKQITYEGEYAGENVISIEKKHLNRLANGVYHIIIIGRDKEGIEVRSKPMDLIILR
jgi:hypothetical protein